MLYLVEGNIFETPAQTLVNTVNTAGAMGKGLAQEFKRLFPDMFKRYQELCDNRELIIGRVWLYRTPNKWVLNFPTKKHWRYPSKIEYIEAGLQAFRQLYEKAGITSIAFPQLGCGNGELAWAVVKPLMIKYLQNLPIDVFIYESTRGDRPEHRDVHRMRQWLMGEPSSYPFAEFIEDVRRSVAHAGRDRDVFGNHFGVSASDAGTCIACGGQEYLVAWQGDEFQAGWLQIWQFLRERGLCTIRHLAELGVLGCEQCVLAILLALPYVRPLQVTNGERQLAATLIEQPGQVGLFGAVDRPSITL